MERCGQFCFRRATLAAACLLALSWNARLACAAPRPAEARLSKEGADFFETRIRPTLVHHCYQCHSGDPAKAKGHLVLDTHEGLRKGGESGAVVAAGHADSSLLIEAIRYEGLEMPPAGKLPDEVIDDFVTWVNMGAPDPRVGKAANPKNKIDLAEARRFWAFQPPKPAPTPKLADTSWPITPIDRLIRARQEQHHLRPVADADRLTLLRRVTFDLTGLPPTPEEVDRFLHDKSPRAFESVVDGLLASPRFGERWGRHWLDVVRFGESTGKDRNLPYRYAWRYRDYVIDAFAQDKPYDRFIIEQLAGDLLPAKDPAERDALVVATGFLAIGANGVNTKEPEQFRMDQIDDQIDVTTRAFLGLTVACARCHDHKFDPIPTADYYALAGIFRSTQTFAGIERGRKIALDSRLLVLAGAEKEIHVAPEIAQAQKAREDEIVRTEGRLEDLRQQLKRRPNGQRQGKQKVRTPPVDRQKIRERIKETEERLDELESVPVVNHALSMGVREADQPSNARLLERGSIDNPGAEVSRGVPRVLWSTQTTLVPPKHSGRWELAHWIASPGNPLTARVMVNRVWAHLFGQGLVDTVDNFGALGNEPSHPELLDALALDFMNQKWSVKKLIRSIVLSRAYQLSSDYDAASYEHDPADRLLWRKEPRRLDAEEIRDALLQAAGQSNLERPAGSPILEVNNRPLGGGKGIPTPSVRSVYLAIPRGIVPDGLRVFDMADPNLIVGKRDATNVPTQALYLLNSGFVQEQARQMANRITQQDGLDRAGRIALAYRTALGRPPTASEQASVVKFLEDYRQAFEHAGARGNARMAAWVSFCQALFATGEFRYVY